MNFDLAFNALTGNAPFPWQRALYEHFAGAPLTVRRCAIPTGLGKTSIIPIWLVALAANPANVPRRLVYVINRRTVVDQATDEAMALRGKLVSREADGAVELRERLNKLCVNSETVPLAISTLRGQFADNREWSADPSRPAVILGTVDMIGSRLLFSGYGVGFRLKPLHAGFLGQDVLLVHDEAHLEPAFQRLLDAVSAEQKRCNDLRPFRVIELSATTRNYKDPIGSAAPDVGNQTFGLTDQDLAVPEIRKRIYAKKAVRLHENDDEKKLPDRLAELALQHKGANRTVLVFARTVEAVKKIAASLRKVSSSVETLTGTLRGKERDALIDRPVFRRFLPTPEPGEETAYLVCTSAGEVGVNISATDLVCDLSTFESIAQRFLEGEPIWELAGHENRRRAPAGNR